MAQITSGLVSIEDGLKKQEEYAPPRKVRVDLSFSVAEGESYEAVFNLASEAATNRVHSLLHGTAIKAVEQSPEDAAPPKRKRRTAAELAAAGASNIGDDGARQTSDDPTNGEDNVIHLPDEASDDEFDITGEAPKAEPADDEFDIAGEEPATEAITDADLTTAVRVKNAELNNPDLIRDIIKSYSPDPIKPFQLRQIPEAKRSEFLAKLAKLAKAS